MLDNKSPLRGISHDQIVASLVELFDRPEPMWSFDNWLVSVLENEDFNSVSAFLLTAISLQRKGVKMSDVRWTKSDIPLILPNNETERYALHRAILQAYLKKADQSALFATIPYHDTHFIESSSDQRVVPTYKGIIFPYTLITIPQKMEFPNPAISYPGSPLRSAIKAAVAWSL